MQLFIFTLAISTLIFIRRITTFPLRNWDEAWYAEVSKNMASGTWGHLMQFWNGRYYFDHAPLYFWLSAPIFRLFGPGEWQARFISVISAIACVCLVFLIGRRLFGAQAGFFSAFVFLTLGGVVMRFSHGNLDSLLICLFLSTFYFFLKSSDGKAWLFLSGVTFGLGLLVKSWGIGLFPLVLISTHVIFQKDKHYKKVLSIFTIGIVVCAWWYAAGLAHYGRQFLDWYLLNPSEGRLVSPFQNFSLDYFLFALRDLGAWSFIPLVCLLFVSIKKVRLDKNVFPLIFVALVYVTFLNFLSDKSDWYLIPAYPLFAIVVGYALSQLSKTHLKLTFLIFAFLVVIGWRNAVRVENIYPDRSAVGANLGVEAARIIPFGDEVILDDHDFTSFLYYSGQNHIYTLQNDRKPEEWWILKEDELDGFLRSNKKTWIVTSRPDSFSTGGSQAEKVFQLNSYVFLKFYSD